MPVFETVLSDSSEGAKSNPETATNTVDVRSMAPKKMTTNIPFLLILLPRFFPFSFSAFAILAAAFVAFFAFSFCVFAILAAASADSSLLSTNDYSKL